MIHLAALVLTALNLSTSAALDEEGLPFDYIRPVKGGQYIFVMLRPVDGRKYAYDYDVYADATSQKHTSRDGLLFKKYPASGLYRKGSTKALWTVDWYSFSVSACSDGEHLVRFGPWARSSDNGNTLAVGFYRSGKEIKSYTVRDLVPDLKDLPRSVSHYQWMKSSSLDDTRKQLRIRLLKDYYKAGELLTFDLRTGEKQANAK
jgi:hypothetical protein